MEKELKALKEKYRNDAVDYIYAKLTIANIEQEYWQKLSDTL